MGPDLQVSSSRELAEIIRVQGEIVGKLELIITKIESHDKRVAWLESKTNWAIGALGALTFIISAGFEFMKGLFR
jgi:hypothetical protein